jgi:uncharacterized protein (TIGR02145 family)
LKKISFFLIIILFLIQSCKKEKEEEIDQIAEITFNPSITYGSMTDQDGNIYKTVTIGNQKWMAENLRTKTYRNGDKIPYVSDAGTWGNLTSGAYCYFNNDSRYIHVFGLLYNGYAARDSRNIAPLGWHLSTDKDWTILVDYLGGKEKAPDKLIEATTSHWNVSSPGTNTSGFTALPGGYIIKWKTIFGLPYNGPAVFNSFGIEGYWWTPENPWSITASFCQSGNSSMTHIGLSIRCVKD